MRCDASDSAVLGYLSAVQGSIARTLFLQELDIYIRSALAGPFAHEQRLSFTRFTLHLYLLPKDPTQAYHFTMWISRSIASRSMQHRRHPPNLHLLACGLFNLLHQV